MWVVNYFFGYNVGVNHLLKKTWELIMNVGSFFIKKIIKSNKPG